MIVISGIVTGVLLSPLLFVLLLAAGILLVVLQKRKAALWLLGSSTALLLLLSLAVVSDSVLRPLERKWPAFPASPPTVDAIVVLGGGVRQGAADEPAGGSLTEESRARVLYAAILSRRLGVPVIVSGGETWAERFGRSEAEVGAAMLVSLGVPAANIIQEGKSRTTRENAAETAKIIRGRRMSRVALVTSAVHMPRAMRAFAWEGISCVPAPTNYRSRAGYPGLIDFLPSFRSLQDSFDAFREYCGIFLYALRG